MVGQALGDRKNETTVLLSAWDSSREELVTDYTSGGLFCGIGGLCMGFKEAGVSDLWSIDMDEYAEQTYNQNFRDSNFIRADVRTLKASDLSPVDVLHAGFPCQSFSQAGERRGFEDERGKLFFDLMRIIEEFKDQKPKVLVFENSPFLRYGEGGAWFLQLQAAIRRAGYWFREANVAELNTFELTALPQQRNRLFMVALSVSHFKSGRFQFPMEKDSTQKRLSDFIDFNGEQEDGYYLPEGNRYHSLISEKASDRSAIYQLRKYEVRVKEPGVCPTLTANMGIGGHNVPFVFDQRGLRKLTEDECLRLQGFPGNFSFPESVPRHRRYVQVGNAVAPPLAKVVARQVVERLDSEASS